ncbi:MAG: cell shape determining protein MreB/Mrl family [Symbiobacteriaceae bacterium]|jgi:rod shape-determining protein MreB|nr:cell shape determining protein MreB/Mrl family [Symbiobacteriaceae bacterium]
MFAQEIGIDLGSANTVVVAKRKGIIAREPSVVAINRNTQAVVAVGAEAHRMIGRTPDTIMSAHPVRGGVISDMEQSTALLRHVMRKIAGSRWLRPRVIMTMQTSASELERHALAEAAIQAGAGEVLMVEETVAAGLGAGLPVDRPVGSLLVDIGSGTTNIAVISLGGVVVSASAPVAGDQLDEVVARYIKREFSLLIGSPTAERVKVEVGAALPGRTASTMIVGRHMTTGNPCQVQVGAAGVYEAMAESLTQIDLAVQSVLERTPPELMADISRSGIVLTGGGSMMTGMAERMSQVTGLAVRLAESPQESVAIGTAVVLEHPNRINLYRVKPARRGKK